MRKMYGLAGVILGLGLAAATAHADMWGNTIDVTTEMDIDRTWDDVVAANFVYGPKQSYDAMAKETHVWLPYGNTEGLYYSGSTVGFEDPSGSGVGRFYNTNAMRSASLAIKLHFDKPIQSFRYTDSWSSWNLQPDDGDVIAGGVEYSLNGTDWTTLVEITSAVSSTFEPFADSVSVAGLNNQDLYLRYYTRNQTTPASMSGGARYLQFRTVGAPNWGPDGFFGNQWDVIVTTPEPTTLGLLGLSIVGLLRRKG